MSPKAKGQLEFELPLRPEPDRNRHLGGRSFYFFDFDDNIAMLATPIVLFEKGTGHALKISSGSFAQEQARIGKSGLYENYEIDWDHQTGSFKYFRDHHEDELHRLGMKQQVFIEDVAHALGLDDFQWKGPSWTCFSHATFNQRPISIITARGHSPSTIQQGINVFVQQGLLPLYPNYLGIYPVNHPETRQKLGDAALVMSVAELKKKAIRASVERAIDVYGYSDHHRFGMSDDDPKNLQLILDEMRDLKKDYPRMSFHVIDTAHGRFVKHEVLLTSDQESKVAEDKVQFSLF